MEADKKIERLLETAKKYKEKILSCPLGKSKIAELESSLKKKFPKFFRTYLERVGIFQDLFPETIFENLNDYVKENTFFQDNYSNDAGYFPFSSDGFGNLMLLQTLRDSEDDMIFTFDHEKRRLRKTKKNFTGIIERHLEKISKNFDKEKWNHEKRWSVQFSIDSSSDELLYENLSAIGFLINNKFPWKFIDKSEAGVSSYTLEISYKGKAIQLGKMTYEKWTTHIYSFNLTENAVTVCRQSTIKDIESALLGTHGIESKLINYGIL